MIKEVLTGCLGVVMLSDRLIILGVPFMLSWECEDDLPEDLLLLLLPMEWPPDREQSLSKLPSLMLCIRVSVSDRLSGCFRLLLLVVLLVLFPDFISTNSDGFDDVLGPGVSGKYIFGFF